MLHDKPKEKSKYTYSVMIIVTSSIIQSKYTNLACFFCFCITNLLKTHYYLSANLVLFVLLGKSFKLKATICDHREQTEMTDLAITFN